jgi:mono/diheme cytochrome c family protein
MIRNRVILFGFSTLVWKLVPVSALGSPFPPENGQAIFTKNCASCHGKDGKARTPIARKLGVKDLTISILSDEQIKKQIHEGSKDPKGKQIMPAYREKFTNEEVDALVTYVKGLRR